MQLNDCGRIVEGEWLQTAILRTTIELDAFAVMPNDVHGIVVIVGEANGGAKRIRFKP
jgi:putative transposase